jgi:hypothetical protein
MFVVVVTLIIFLFPGQLLDISSGRVHLCALIGFSNSKQESNAANQPNLRPILHALTSITLGDMRLPQLNSSFSYCKYQRCNIHIPLSTL